MEKGEIVIFVSLAEMEEGPEFQMSLPQTTRVGCDGRCVEWGSAGGRDVRVEALPQRPQNWGEVCVVMLAGEAVLEKNEEMVWLMSCLVCGPRPEEVMENVCVLKQEIHRQHVQSWR